MKNKSIINILVVFVVIAVSFLSILGKVYGDSFREGKQVQEILTTQTATPATDQPPVLVDSQVDTRKISLSLEEIGYTEDITVQGVTVSQSYGVRWPGTWAIKSGSTLTLEFSHPQNLASYSTVAVDFNDVRIGSIILTPENSDHGSIVLDIPANLIRIGYNDLTLQFYMGISDNYCDDLENPGVWATIHNTTALTFPYEKTAPTTDLSLFPYPFLQESELLVNQVTFVVPDRPSPAELNAVSILSAKLGQLNSFYTMDIKVLPISKAGDVLGNVVYVGLAQNINNLFIEEFPFVKMIDKTAYFVSLQGEALNQDDGILWVDISPTDPKSARLIVTGQTGKAVETAAKGLANDSVYVRLVGQMGIIQDVPTAAKTGVMKPVLAFEDLGYVDQTASGTVKQTINYVLSLPSEWRVATEAVLDLHISHSDLIYAQGSVLTVAVNDIPVGSKLLTPENADYGEVLFNIPARLFTIGSNTLSVITDIQLPYDPQDQYFCNKDHFNDAWVTVYSDSTLTLPDGPRTLILDLKNYPSGYAGADNLSDFAFIVPDASDSTIAQAVAWIASRLGQNSNSMEFSPSVISGSEMTSETHYQYEILIGEPSKNPAVVAINDILPVPFDKGKTTLQNPDQIAQIISPSGSGSIGYIQSVLTSDGQSRLVVTGNSTEGVLWAAQALNDQNTLDQLKGDFAVLNSPGAVYSAIVSEEATAPIESISVQAVESTVQSIFGVSTKWVLMLAGGMILLTLLILTIFVAISVRKRNK